MANWRQRLAWIILRKANGAGLSRLTLLRRLAGLPSLIGLSLLSGLSRLPLSSRLAGLPCLRLLALLLLCDAALIVRRILANLPPVIAALLLGGGAKEGGDRIKAYRTRSRCNTRKANLIGSQF